MQSGIKDIIAVINRYDGQKPYIEIFWLCGNGRNYCAAVIMGHYCTLYCWTNGRGGQFGDQFGAVNALFSGLAFAGLIITILQQRKGWYYQRKELE